MIPLLQHPFWFLRHGETVANAADVIAGSTDSPLTAQGQQQADQAALLLAGMGIASVWASPLSRARVTAETVVARIGAPLTLLPGLAERDWGVWEGRPRSTLDRDATPPGGESAGLFRARIRAALAEISGPFPVLIVAHSGTARELHALLSGQSFRRPGNAVPIRWQRGADGHWAFVELSPACQTEPLGNAAKPQ